MITTMVAQRWMIHEAVAPPVATNAELAQLQHDEEENTIQDVVEELAAHGMPENHKGQDLQQDDCGEQQHRPHCSAKVIDFSRCVLFWGDA